MRLLTLVLGCAVLSFGCTADFATQNEADVILRIVKIVGLEGEEENEGDVLFSDVTPVFNDNAEITFQAISKNPTLPDPGPFNDVFLERYEVRYIRTDGRNTEGVDVPYRFTGGMATLVPSGGDEAAAAIMVVRHQAKLEPPLRNLAFVTPTTNGGGQGILTVVAEITFHGRTTSGKAVSTTGRLTISFADFADDEPPPTTATPPPLASPLPVASPPTLASPSPSPSPSASPR
jgi:hypothetical protein